MNLNKRRSISYAKFGYLFILPFFIVYLFFQIYPLFYTFYLSSQSNGDLVTDSVGMDNFKIILSGQPTTTPGHEIAKRAAQSASKNFFRVLGNTCILWVGNFIPQIIISLLLAAWFTDAYLKVKGKGFYKIVMYMPNIITAASVAALFVMLFNDSEYGAVNNFLVKLGKEKVNFVAGIKGEARIMIMIIQTWMWFGNTTIMLMSGIMGINPSLFEAANIDGATPTQQFFRITIPLLRPILLYTVVTSMIGGLQMFDIPYLYNAQAGAQNITTETVAVYIYNNFHKTTAPNLGYSAAASVILFFITAALGAIAFVTNLEEDPRSAHAKGRNKTALKIKLGGA
ncbi:MAG: sugar ABC transporter permease [Oscillospiraceae bacterium]|nr:sugar ABC transporter permease [Oscillospiraceae bacterium]